MHSGLYAVLNVTKKPRDRNENEMVIIDQCMSILDFLDSAPFQPIFRILSKRRISRSDLSSESRIHLYS